MRKGVETESVAENATRQGTEKGEDGVESEVAEVGGGMEGVARTVGWEAWIDEVRRMPECGN